MAKKSYTAIFEYDAEDSCWLVHLKEEPRCHTFGSSIRDAREAILDAMDAWEIEPEQLRAEVVSLPRGAPKYVSDYLDAKARFEALQARVSKLSGKSVLHFRERGFSMRDTGEILGISFQRVGQLEKATLAELATDAALNEGSGLGVLKPTKKKRPKLETKKSTRRTTRVSKKAAAKGKKKAAKRARKRSAKG